MKMFIYPAINYLPIGYIILILAIAGLVIGAKL